MIISPEAGRELLEHAAFMARVSKKAAERLINSFDTAIKSLENMPQRCPTLNHIYICQKISIVISYLKKDT